MRNMDAWNYAMQRMDESFGTLNAFLMGLSSGNVHAGGMLALSEDMRQSLRAVWNECVTYIGEVEAELLKAELKRNKEVEQSEDEAEQKED